MSLVLIFDLDDTLYDERTYVESGFRAVAAEAERRFGWEAKASFRMLRKLLDENGRGAIFNTWLESHGKLSKAEVKRALAVYRAHTPEIHLNAPAKKLLPKLARNHPLYLITDGNKLVQQKKIDALGLAPLFRKTYVTHCYGVAHAKPSPRCFELIRAREKCAWSDMVYVGDNPAKDFLPLNRLGGHTIRVLTGCHAKAIARPGYEAQHVIASLEELPDVLAAL
ncbi:putative hydrolase of the HAD superfamily [Rhizomicrobium palustre]|uniref:Putative hydrolase of the HAD superfamily n=1 Tax=Rhizomicrobium palustre TaxID=189966 RepID=A0A846MXD4_9PROT|nr:HAD family hydrolase [Rhizomicrobium palustre]NIK88066.1 putative hydrolase of the HAD superfamily [Rhizomicrobium palustre]